MTRPARRREDGFTLVEMLVSLTLLAIIGMVMLLGYETIASSWRRADARADMARSLARAEALLDRLLSRAYPAVTGDPGAQHVDFTGSAGRIEFLAPLPQRFGAAAIARYRLAATADGALRLSVVPDLDGAAAEQTTILDGLASVAIDYFGANPTNATPRWQSDWTSRKTLPELIRLRLTRRGALRATPEIIVAPRITASPDCAFDPRDGKCRTP
jgi:general secretion pathway protein J